MKPTSRRDVLRLAALGGAAATVRVVPRTDDSTAPDDSASSASPSANTVELYGAHQPGIATPAQDRMAFAAFDIASPADLDGVKAVLGTWAAAAARMMAGLPIGAIEHHPERPPIDTGEAFGLGPGNLTITVGFGPTFFDERLGLQRRRPELLRDLPTFRNDVIRPEISGGDLCVQACSDDPQVAFHVIRNFARIGRGVVTLRWSQLGFGRTSSTSVGQETPRNLMGFKDGTNDIKAENGVDMNRFVWVGDADQPWLAGGTYLISRRIRMLIESWDNTSLAEQERVIGRHRTTGAPLGAEEEFDPVDLDAVDSDGNPVVDVNAHIRLSSPTVHGGVKMLRRGYSFTDGIDPRTGRLDAGLFFIAFVRDPDAQFVPVQAELGRNDLLNEYIKHTSSGIYAIPPGLSEVGDWYGKALFD